MRGEKKSDHPQFSDHYFTGDYPIKPLDNLQGLQIKQLSLLVENQTINQKSIIYYYDQSILNHYLSKYWVCIYF